jgi:hypothetical protein
MSNNRVPKQVLLEELVEGRRPIGRPKLRYKDVCYKSSADFLLHLNTWEELTEDRIAWRAALRSGIEASESAFFSKLEDNDVNEKWLRYAIQICQVPVDRLHKAKKAVTHTHTHTYIYKNKQMHTSVKAKTLFNC